MPRYAVLLRGINVGGRTLVPMADLRALLSGLGFTDVRTLLQSGNAVLTSPDVHSADPTDPTEATGVAQRIEQAVEQKFDRPIRCLVRTADELRSVIENNPLSEVATNGSRMMALFLSENPDPALLAQHDPVALAPTEIAVGDRVIYQWCPDGVSNAPLVGPFVEKKLKIAVTGRNWNTVSKLIDLLDV
jgi:uncharacterized protein (DUF1697 family)